MKPGDQERLVRFVKHLQRLAFQEIQGRQGDPLVGLVALPGHISLVTVPEVARKHGIAGGVILFTDREVEVGPLQKTFDRLLDPRSGCLADVLSYASRAIILHRHVRDF